MGYVSLDDMNELSYEYYGYSNGNPIIWVKSDIGEKCYSPSNVYINEDGEIIIEVPVDYLIQ